MQSFLGFSKQENFGPSPFVGTKDDSMHDPLLINVEVDQSVNDKSTQLDSSVSQSFSNDVAIPLLFARLKCYLEDFRNDK